MSKLQLIKLRFLFRNFIRDRNASILPIFGIAVILIIVMAGVAVDVSRVVNARQKLSFALDAAALSIAADLSTSVMTNDQIETALANSLKANLGDAEFLDEAVKNLTHNVEPEKGLVTVASSATLENYFIDIGGYMMENIGPEAFTFGTSAQVAYSTANVELALVLDVTGSMEDEIESLKKAASSAVNTLIPKGTAEADSKVRISVIPYSQGVNVGEFAQRVTNGAKGTQNCVTERQGAAQFTDDPYDYDSKNDKSYFGGGSNACAPTPQMEPLTAKRSKLETAIEKLTTSGGTAGQTGIAWGWYTLSPNWADLWHKDSTPAAYSDKKVLKFAIIMTDGDNNHYYGYDELRYGWYKKDGYWTKGSYTCPGWCEISESETYNNTSSERSRDLCKAMKDTGIVVFGVYFGTKSNSAGARNMKSCSSTGNYYEAISSDELIGAFGNIAKKIQAIHLAR